MKVLLVSIFVPTPENRGGPSQLVHDLALEVPDKVELDLLVYADVGADELARLVRIFGRVRTGTTRRLPALRRMIEGRLGSRRYEPPEDIDYRGYDVIWLYQEWLYPDFKELHETVVVSGMDCATLLYWRSLALNPGHRPLAVLKKLFLAWRLERSIRRNHVFHVVGEADLGCFRRLNGRCRSFRSPHPLPPFREVQEGGRPTGTGSELVVAVTGAKDAFYQGRLMREIVDAAGACEDLRQVRWVFLGRGWEAEARRLSNLGCSVEAREWVDDYAAFMASVDVHLVPIRVGAGTKGKVLVSVASGVVTIGTPVAWENVTEDTAGLSFADGKGAVDCLRQIMSRRMEFATRARSLAEATRKRFDRARVARDFWREVLRVGSSESS